MISLLIAIGILVLLGYLIWLGYRFLETNYALLQPETKAFIIVLLAAVLLALFVAGYVFRSGQRMNDKAVHPEKAIVYKSFIDIWQAGIKTGVPIREEDDLQSAMTLWAGGKVLSEYLKLHRILDQKPAQLDQIIKQVEKVILEIRTDIGSGNRGVLSGDILKLLSKNE